MGATAACTVRLGEGTNTDNDTITTVIGDAWFGSVRAAVEAADRGMESIYQIKTNHGLYPKDFIEEHLKDAPGGTHIVLKGSHPTNEHELIAIGYRYNSKVTLSFVITTNAGSTLKGTPYEMKFTDSHGNVHVRLVDRPSVISQFFESSNCVDKHNQARQYELALEKKWDTRDPYFRLATTLVGINVVDSWKLAFHHTLFSRLQMKHNTEQHVTVNVFAGILTKQLLRKAKNLMKSMATSTSHDIANVINSEMQEQVSELSQSYASADMALNRISNKTNVCYYPMVANKQGKNYRKSRRCATCNKLTVTYCGCCDKSYCYPVGGKKHTRTCLNDHFEEIKKNTYKTYQDLRLDLN